MNHDIWNRNYKNNNSMIKNKKNNSINENKNVYDEYINVKRNIENYAICVVNLYMEKKVSHIKNHKELKKLMKEEKKVYHYGDIHESDYCSSPCFVTTIINDVSFGVNKGKCFCILGPKGSGKTSLLDMITKYTTPTDGNIYFNGINSNDCPLEKLSMSYCAQEETYWKYLNLKHQIEYELKLRGCSSKDYKTYAQQYIQYFNLEKRSKTNMYLSDDTTKRIVKFIMTICSQTDFIVLDEPTVGMDIESKEKIWEAIQQIRKTRQNTTIIIATSSLEEARKLGDSIGILVNGHLECIGTIEEIEKYYCQRFILKVNSKSIPEFQQNIMEKSHLFGNDYFIEDEFNSWITFNVSLQQTIGNVFEVMEHYKSSELITEYSFSKLTLEQLYLNFAKYQVKTIKSI
ncbi:hypothetical protein PIROE2DRAFT_59080 [Piromyces sp. E2]|nr:hypothetical protein PIROE2DRAFT_59080 [Piromyces sp. E2]|eukprot:OUM66900.1 hypothetical protein PIROE2DRAFT_59080 [Piromyces sp. E2]